MRPRVPNTQATLAALDRVRLLLRAGVPAHRAFAQGQCDPASVADPSVRAVLAVAVATGVPAGHAIERLQDLVRGMGAADDEISSALAAPLLARRIVMWVPVAAVALGAALGFNVLPALVSSELGISCLVGGDLLSLLGWAWMRKLVRRATDHPPAPGPLGRGDLQGMVGGSRPGRGDHRHRQFPVRWRQRAKGLCLSGPVGGFLQDPGMVIRSSSKTRSLTAVEAASASGGSDRPRPARS